MNLLISLRQQLTQMDQWYKNALITNVVLDYLSLETEDINENVKTIQGLVDSGRVKSFLEGTSMVYTVDGIRVFTILKTTTDVKRTTKTKEVHDAVERIRMDVAYEFTIDFKSKPEKGAPPNNVIPINVGRIEESSSIMDSTGEGSPAGLMDSYETE
jgi:hypothetical protein